MKKKILPSTSVIDSPRKGWMTLAPCVLGVAKVGVEVGNLVGRERGSTDAFHREK